MSSTDAAYRPTHPLRDVHHPTTTCPVLTQRVASYGSPVVPKNAAASTDELYDNAQTWSWSSKISCLKLLGLTNCMITLRRGPGA
eukprot:2607846-Rhodomonas_salina.3